LSSQTNGVSAESAPPAGEYRKRNKAAGSPIVPMARAPLVALPSNLAQFLDGPPLVGNEKREDYDNFFSAIAAAVNPADPIAWVTSAKARAIAQLLAGENPTEDKLAVAVEFAQAELELKQIRAERAGLLAKIDINRGDPNELRRLVAFDRYERYAHTRRRRVLGRFEQ
jgi:hypothetical protein